MVLRSVYHAMPFSARALRKTFSQIYCDFVWSLLLSTTTGIRVITLVKMLWTHKVQPCESTINFDHCDDAYCCRKEFTPS